MSKRWTYVDQNGRTTMSEAEIIEEYFPHWQKEMQRLQRDHLISHQACIEDWIVVNWAEDAAIDD